MRTYADPRQDDTTGDEDDVLRAADMDEDGFVVLAGSGANNFQVIKLDPDGGEVWRFQVRNVCCNRPI